MNDSEQTKLWAKRVAEVLIEGMEPGYIKHWIENADYIFPFAGEQEEIKKKDCSHRKLLLKSENASREVLNKYYTGIVREQMIKLTTIIS